VLVEYPVYPLSNILEQRNCVCRAMRMIRSIDLASLFAAPIQMSTHIPTSASKRLILSGHSSGANICALALLRACGDGYMLCDAFVSLSGVFDICKHYEFERSRGVHIVSPMGAAAGRDMGRFWEVSPTLLLQQLPHPTSHISSFFPPCLLLHGTLDTTVPMTSSMDMARGK
jgi:acetyl esterase/lipase